ncbi:MAG TPA: ABC transporter substrate-binding protein [Phototrophicaceae bacterium]|nr:ABC transporter substrate-binding protein [Phototrophicaceae bacterium]
MFSRRKSRNLGILLAALVLSTVLGAFAQASTETAGKGGKMVVADPASNGSLDPFVASWHDGWVMYAIYSTLFVQDKDLNYQGFLADTWEAAPDGKSLTIHLIHNAKFTDGTPVDGAAVKWNLDKYADKDTGATAGADLVGLLTSTTVDPNDPYTITLNLNADYAPLYYELAALEIVSPTAYQKEGKDNFGTAPVGAGPFELEKLTPNSDILMKRNPDFDWAPKSLYSDPGPVGLDELDVNFLDEDQTVLAALQTGELTAAGIPAANLTDVENDPNITVSKGALQEIRYVGFNTSKAPWDNVKLRQAFAYATDRDEVNQIAYNGLATPIYQPLPPTIWGNNPALDANSYHFDPDKAKQMLDDLGYKDVDGDGMRETPDGKPWDVPLAVPEGDEYAHMAQALQGEWNNVGIPVQINTMSVDALKALTQTGKHDLFLLYYGYGDPSILTYFFAPDRKGGSNRAWFSSDELTALLTKADSDLNQTTRYQTITQLSQYVIDQSPWIFLENPPSLTGVRKELKNWSILPNQTFLFWNSYIDSSGS